jgi:hypothetical protein
MKAILEEKSHFINQGGIHEAHRDRIFSLTFNYNGGDAEP